MSGNNALVTGISGQDGAYMAQALLQAGKCVVGTLRPTATKQTLWRLQNLGIEQHPKLRLEALDLEDAAACDAMVRQVQPATVFHLAGGTRVGESFLNPLASARLTGMGTWHLLEATRQYAPDAHFVFASTAELFGEPQCSPQNELTPFRPRSPYAVAKQFAHGATVCYRDGYNLRSSCAILFNHESPLRDPDFVTRKITLGVARIVLGQAQEITLGNLGAQRDFGFAPEYVAAMITMAEQSHGDDYVLASGVGTSVREFVRLAFSVAGIEIEWRGVGLDEIGVEVHSAKPRVRINPAFFRPLDAHTLVGDAAKARSKIAFSPNTDVKELARLMVTADIARVRAGCA